MEVIRFQTNVPETVALKFDEGQLVEGRFGDQLYYSLAHAGLSTGTTRPETSLQVSSLPDDFVPVPADAAASGAAPGEEI